MESLVSIGKQIAQTRKELNLRQIDLAARAGLSRATIDALENGRKADLGVSKLNRVLAAVGLELTVRPLAGQRPTLDELLEEADDD